MTVIVTGFEPYDGASQNPSWQAVSTLPQIIADNSIIPLQLPVVYNHCWDVLEEAIRIHRPNLVICCGVAANRQTITPELTAFNEMSATIPDNAGVLCNGRAIVSEGQARLDTDLELAALINQMSLRSIPCSISENAGRYVCNNLYYHLLANRDVYGYQGLFVHVPSTEACSYEICSQALSIIIEYITAQRYLTTDPVLHIDMSESLRSAKAYVSYCGKAGVLLGYGRDPGYFTMSAPDQHSAELVASYLPPDWGCVVTHHMYEIEALQQLGNISYSTRCCNAAYMRSEPLPLSGSCHIRPLTQDYLDYAAFRYHLFRRKNYLTGRIAAGEVWGAWVEDRLCGFIGLHDEWSMGMLEVDPDSRRHHLGTELESWLINQRLEQGFIPFAQIVLGNDASMGLQARLGLSFSEFGLCWCHPVDPTPTAAKPLSPFRRSVYQVVSAIPQGKVATYSQIAQLIGSPNSARAVGNALHRNASPEDIPCWRVVSSKGALSSQYAFGGLQGQQALLEQDGIFVENGRVELNNYQWQILR